MTDIWEIKNIKPMLIGTEGEPFDSDEYIYELKLDGERCIAYLDSDKTILKNKRNILMLPKVPELAEIHKNNQQTETQNFFHQNQKHILYQ